MNPARPRLFFVKGNSHASRLPRFPLQALGVDTITRFLFVCIALSSGIAARAAEPVLAPPHFTGSQSCKSSSCHGGGVDKGQSVIWEKKDVHAKAHERLTTDRAKRMADSLGIADATKSGRCTI